MHADGFGHSFKIERLEMSNSEPQEPILLAHDLGCDFENGLGALIERADQPARGLQALCEVSLFTRIFRSFRDLGVIALADQNFGQRIRIKLDDPVAIRALAYKHVWN